MVAFIDHLHCHTQIPANVDVEMYVSCDDDAPIAAIPTDEGLLQCEDDINEEEEIQERVKPSDAISAAQVLKDFLVEADSVSPDFLSKLPFSIKLIVISIKLIAFQQL